MIHQHPSENDYCADDAAEDAEETDTPLSSVTIGGRPLWNLRFANDTDLLGGTEEELQQLTEKLEKTAAGYGMEISSDKSKNSRQQHQPKTIYQRVDAWKTPEEVDPFKYLGSTLTKDGTSVKEVKIILSHDKAGDKLLWKKQRHQLSYKD